MRLDNEVTKILSNNFPKHLRKHVTNGEEHTTRNKNINQSDAVSHIQQGKQRKLSVMTLRFPLSPNSEGIAC